MDDRACARRRKRGGGGHGTDKVVDGLEDDKTEVNEDGIEKDEEVE